jgi:hypothetical protein
VHLLTNPLSGGSLPEHGRLTQRQPASLHHRSVSALPAGRHYIISPVQLLSEFKGLNPKAGMDTLYTFSEHQWAFVPRNTLKTNFFCLCHAAFLVCDHALVCRDMNTAPLWGSDCGTCCAVFFWHRLAAKIVLAPVLMWQTVRVVALGSDGRGVDRRSCHVTSVRLILLRARAASEPMDESSK